jgi:hypothetical protein
MQKTRNLVGGVFLSVTVYGQALSAGFADTKRKGPLTSTIPTKRTRADAPSNPDQLKATVGEHRTRHTRDECRGTGKVGNKT